MAPTSRRFLTIVLGTTLLACVLGICMDMVTANVAVAYFLPDHHPKVVESENPWVLALVWGIGASWWFGAIAGVVVATINHRREHPLLPRRILKWALVACVVLWVLMIAVVFGVISVANTIPVEERRPTFESDRNLVAVAVAHQLEYLLGAIAMLVIGIMTWRAKAATTAPEAT